MVIKNNTKNRLLILIIFVSGISFAQIDCCRKTFCVRGEYFEHCCSEVSSLPKDSLFFPATLPQNKNHIVYFDIIKKQIATIITFDTIYNTINYKHFNRSNILIKEQQVKYSRYKKDYNLNPLNKNLREIEYVKIYRNDSLLFDAKNEKGVLICRYNNPQEKTHFEKRVFSDCEYTKEFYENNQLKSVCWSSKSEEQLLDNGDVIIELLSDCSYFDINGCLIEKK